jgi:CHASE2 domain-containing sensor protein
MTSRTKIRTRAARTWERARRPDREHVEALKARVPYWFVALVLFAFSVLQIALNPFGFSDLTQRYTQDISNLLITGPYLYPTTGREQITVALVDEPTLHHLQMPWPWNYSAHARALDALLAYKPKAVVVDFLFVDSRVDDSLGELVEEIARYKKAGVPLYFEGGTDLPYGEAPLRPELAKTGVRILDPSIEVYDGVVRQYPASGHCFGPGGQLRGQCPSLALQVYRDLYPEHPPAPLKGKMELVWGTETAPFNVTFNDRTNLLSCNEKTSFLLRIYRAFFDKKTAAGRCPYNNDVPVEALLAGGYDDDLNRLIPNHVIFYGGALQGAQDKSFSPVNGLQPNVFVHAMALDNLITFAGRPEQNVMSLGPYTFSNEPAQVMAIIPVILILSYLHLRRIRARRRAAHGKEHGALYEWFSDKGIEHLWQWLAFFLALGIGLLLARWAGLSVANWVEDVFISVELAAMLLLGVPDSFWGYLRHVAGGRPDDILPEATA